MMKNLINISFKMVFTIVLPWLLLIYALPSYAAPDPSIGLTAEEKVWLVRNPTIHLGIDRSFPPFSSINRDGEYVGFTADIMELIAKKLGVKFETYTESSWSETLELAQQSKIDLIAGVVPTTDRSEYLQFTPSYIDIPSIIVSNMDIGGYIGSLQNLENKTVAVELGSSTIDVLERDYPKIKLIKVKTTEAALGFVARGKADAYVGNAVTTTYSTRLLGLNNLAFSGNTEYFCNHTIGTVKPNQVLASIMAKTLQSIDQNIHEEISGKWLGMKARPHIQQDTAIALAILAIFLLTIAAIWIYTLKRSKQALFLSEQKVRQQASFDSLTGLLNRRQFNDVLTAETQKNAPFALLFLDINQFKEVNDALGHSVGDVVLKRIARRLKKSVRATDILARLGGDEFVIILKCIHDPAHLEKVVGTVQSSLKSEFMIESHSIHISTCIGVTLFPRDAKNTDEILINTDHAMNASKLLGPDSYSFFDDSMREALSLKNATLRDLKNRGITDQFRLYYQPIIDLKTGRITKAEALIRWQHPERGLIGPAEFVELAEDSGLINEMGQWIFETATKQAAQWRRTHSHDLQISINTSPLQYRDNGINVNDWLKQLEELNLSGKALVLEITENLLMDTSHSIKEKLNELASSGIEVAIDDFGTGYSSLSYMKKFDIDYLKIDQSFVKNLTEKSEDMALCEAMIVMAHKLGCKVVAEGIETKQQCSLLKKAGCDFGQGYLFSRPVNTEDFEKLLAKGQRTLDPTASSQISLQLYTSQK